MLSVTKIKHHLGLDGTDDDPLLTDFELGVTAEITRLTGRYLGLVASQVETKDGPARGRQLTSYERNEFPFMTLDFPSVVPLLTDSTWVFEYRTTLTTTWLTFDKTTIVFERDASNPWRIYKLTLGWEPGQRRNRITYDAGYVEDEAPEAIMAMALRMVTLQYLPSALRSLPSNLESARIRGAELEFRDVGGNSYARFLDENHHQISQLKYAV